MIPSLFVDTRAASAKVKRTAFWDGVWAASASLVAMSAWGMVTGVAMVRSGLTESQAMGMSLLVYAGSAQLAALPLILANAPVMMVLLTALVLNLRFVIFSAGISPHVQHLPLGKRLLLGYLTTDFVFAISMSRWSQEPPEQRGSARQIWFFIGLIVSTWITWQSASLAGILLGTQIPERWGLDFLPILALLAVLVPMVNTLAARVGVGVASIFALLGAHLPLRLGLLLAVLVGVGAAMGVQALTDRKNHTES